MSQGDLTLVKPSKVDQRTGQMKEQMTIDYDAFEEGIRKGSWHPAFKSRRKDVIGTFNRRAYISR